MKNICVDTTFDSYLFRKESYSPLVQPLPSAQCQVCVCVPVQNEEELLDRCLSALANQVDLKGRAIDFARYEVILLANNCNDNSVAIAQSFSRQNPEFRLHIIERILPISEAYIGRVRQILMDEAYYRLSSLTVGANGIIASTDGDTEVDSTWIAATILEISQGVDAVGGRIIADSVSCAALDLRVKKRYLQGDHYHQLKTELEAYLDPNPYDPLPRHPQHYGASLAVTAQMYRQAGGMPSVRTLEDVEFYRSLLRVGARFRHSPLVQVTTSARQTIRTEGGFAAQLNEWAVMKQPFLVESLEAIETKIKTRCQLRQLWERILDGYQYLLKDIVPYANTLGVSPDWLQVEFTQPHTFALLFERIEARQDYEQTWEQSWSLVSLEQAIADLTMRLQEFRQQEDRTESKFLSQLLIDCAVDNSDSAELSCVEYGEPL